MSKREALWFHQLQLPKELTKSLIECFQTSEALYSATEKDYKKCGISEEWAHKIEVSKEDLDKSEQLMEKCEKEGIQLITWEESEYPIRLKEINDYPAVLFLKGEAEVLQRPMVAVVGSRKCSEYGYEVAKKIGEELAAYGIGVISGMATGIDEAAHQGAVRAGKTIAVLGTGVDVCYPARNRRLYETIQQKGCVLSEFMPGDQGLPYHFPLRNRIISGMSLGTVVVEAKEKSGSLITAHLALEQNREVFAIPGNIFSLFSKGTNKLIQAGAKLVMTTEDILEEISHLFPVDLQTMKDNLNNNQSVLLDKVEIIVYDCLSWQPSQIEKIYSDANARAIGLTAQALEMILLKLEMKGLVKRLPARRYSRTK
ncbi:MAG: DNA-processing protein DprA [Cellulosilyticaceae bacterium]